VGQSRAKPFVALKATKRQESLKRLYRVSDEQILVPGRVFGSFADFLERKGTNAQNPAEAAACLAISRQNKRRHPPEGRRASLPAMNFAALPGFCRQTAKGAKDTPESIFVH
jgi:hypothetical protein